LDLIVAGLGLVILSIPLALIAISIRLSSPGPALHWSRRVGLHGAAFMMPKFRSMVVGSPQVATDLLRNPEQFITPVGRWIRRLSLDELPQLWSVLMGDMSLIGPRPALFNQEALIEARQRCGVDAVRPGITGLAQVSGRDDLPDERKVALDAAYARSVSWTSDARILALTVWRVLRSDGVRH
jgi:O-antigen biosynthesis protein WbqP